MRILTKIIFLLLVVSSVSVLQAINSSGYTAYQESEIMLSKYFALQPDEVRQWKDIKESASMQGFVNYKNMSIYEILALHTDDKNQLHRLARLFALHNVKVINKLKTFDVIYQQEVSDSQ